MLAGLVLATSLGSANAQDLGLTETEQAWIKEHPVVRVHNETNWPPYNFNVDGEPTGFSIDYMRLLAAQAGLDVEFVSGPSWNEFLDMMRSGDLDVMLNIVDTPVRREYLLFTTPYAITSPVQRADKPSHLPIEEDLYSDSLVQEILRSMIRVAHTACDWPDR